MGPRDGDGDVWDRTESLIKRFLEEKGRPLDPHRTIQRWELLRRDLDLTDEDLYIILGRALFEDRLEDVQTFNDLARFMNEVDEMLDEWFDRKRILSQRHAKRKKKQRMMGPDDGDGPIPA